MTAQIIEFPKKRADVFEATAALAFAPIRANLMLMNFLVGCQIAAFKEERNERAATSLVRKKS